ncbi:hypothetical protein CHLRE_10g432500v5 [Chlamydomonas reinhardtii]|uniref:Condensin complex subunit 1 n=1 Tax=Chlamydomonas reinhardtii TaxID=3055 RepID=A0A2K3D9Y5_CHLRE|nr:uncharacterized protein CHLRE_10g432500v5 [Chlamydomonas reinhardtii]PNW77344.1 hypothetical protein CHLRE_10g432500v5 [Chlamydomonas reinhardtii]
MAVFKIPRKIDDLAKEKPGQLCAPDPSCNDPEEACERCIAKLEQTPLGLVNDQEAFECAFVAVSGLERVQAQELVKQLAVAMCKNLHTVATSGLQELGEHQFEKGNPAVVEHLSAVHAYTYFLAVIMQHSQASLAEAMKADAQQKGAAPKKGRGKTKAPAEDGEGGAAELWWDIMGRIARVLVSVLRADLDGVLYRVPAEKSSLLNLVVQAVGRCLGEVGVLKQTKLLGWCNDVLLHTATTHCNCMDAIEFVSSTLAGLWRIHDHGVDVAVDLAVAAAKAAGSAPTRLGKALVGKFCEVSPEAYDEAGKRDVAPVRRAAKLLASMAEKLPEVIHDKMSQLVNYFGCQSADTIRKHLVDCMGSLTRYYMGRQANEAGNLALITSRTNVAAMMLVRANDKSAHVRKAVLDNVAELVDDGMWGHDILEKTAEVAISRLEDGSLVAGAALELLTRLVERHSSLGGQLAEGLLMENVAKLEAQLEDMEPDDMGPDGEEEEGGGANAAMWEQGGVLDAAATQTQAGIIEPTQVDGDTAAPEAAAAKRIPLTYSRIKLLLAILNAELCLARKLTAALPEVESQLASDSAGVIESAIKLLTLLRRVQLEGVEDAWRRVWHMVFSNTEKVRNTVCDAFHTMVSPETEPKDMVGRLRERIKRLLPMMGGLDQRDTQALEELLRLALERGDIQAGTARQAVKDLRMLIQRAGVRAMDGGDDFAKDCADARRLSLLCTMLTRHAPGEVCPEAGDVVGMLKTAHVVLKDAVLVRDLATILGELAAPPHRTLLSVSYGQSLLFSDALANLYSVLLSNYLPETGGGWAAAAQAAIGAIYAIFPDPHRMLEPLLKELTEMIRAGSGHCSTVLLTRAVFIVGCVATQQLALVDKLAKQVRKERTEREKAAAAAGGKKGGDDDMDAQLGTSQARDAALDALQEELEAAILRPGAGLVADWGALVCGLCCRPDLLAADVALAAAALGSLSKLMALDAGYCEANCSIFFTRLTGRGNVKLPTDVRCSMLVALGDLGRRHPNVVEPWTVRMFECLRDEPGEEEVARTCLRILAHLILSDMTKPKGHMAQVARCLVARDPLVKDLALRLFNSLAAKQAKGGKNQVMQYLPEIISDATRGQPMAEQDFKAMMQRLLGYIKLDKLTEQIKVRLVERMENVVVGTPTAAAAAAAPSTASQPAPSAASQPAPSASQPAASVAAATSTGTAGGAAAESGAAGAAAPEGASAVGCTAVHMEAAVREWRGIAACLDMVPYSEKGLRMIIERFKCYKHTLGDEQVYKVFKGIAEHGRKGNRTPELKQEVAEYESRLEEAHNTLREEQLAYRAKLEAERAEAEAAAEKAAGAAAAPEAGAEVSEAAGAESAAAGEEAHDAQMDEEAGPQEQDSAPEAEAVPGWQSEAGTMGGVAAEDAGQEEEEEEEGEEEADDQTEAPPSEEAEGEGEGEEYADCDNGGEAEEEQEEEEQEEDAMDMDADMEDTEWQEARETSAVSTPPSRRGSALASGAGAGAGRRADIGRDDTATSAATPLAHGAAAGTPMAITPAPGEAADGGDGADDMAWSPAPAIAASLAAAAVAQPPQQQRHAAQQENVAPFGGFRIKPDPEALQQQQQQGPLGPMPGFGAGGGSLVLGVRIKPDPDARAQ